MKYSVLLTTAAARDFRKLPPVTKARVRAALESPEGDPRAKAEKLAGSDSYRDRLGDYRIVFRVDDTAKDVLVARIKHPRDSYRG